MWTWASHYPHPLWQHTGGSGAIQNSSSRAEGQWQDWQERQPPKPSVVQLGAQAALMKMPAVRVFMVQNSCAEEARPEGLNLQLTQAAVVIMQPLQLQASSAHHIWVWMGTAGAVQEVWQQSRTTSGCSRRALVSCWPVPWHRREEAGKEWIRTASSRARLMLGFSSGKVSPGCRASLHCHQYNHI